MPLVDLVTDTEDKIVGMERLGMERKVVLIMKLHSDTLGL